MSKKKPFISILIPVYNVADYVEECVDSIMLQIDNDAEIILMDDDSTDNSLQVIQQLTCKQVKVLSAPHNRGLSGTRNALLPHAQGDYVWFIDSDDVMTKNAYKKVKKALKKHKVDVLCGDYYAWEVVENDADKSATKTKVKHKKTRKKAFLAKAYKQFYNTDNAFLKNIIKNNSNHVWNKIYKRELITDVPFKEGLKFEDIYFMTDLSAKTFSYLYINKCLIDYRLRQGSIVQTLDKKYVDDYLGAFIYRVEQWRQRTEQSNDYLLYKSYNRYAGLVKKIKKNNDFSMQEYLYQNYDKVFSSYRLSVGDNITLVRKYKLRLKAIKVATTNKNIIKVKSDGFNSEQ